MSGGEWTVGATLATLATRLMETFAAADAPEAILAAIRDALGGAAAALYLVTPTDGTLRCTYTLCSPSSTDDFSAPEIAAATLRANAPLILPDETPPLVSLPVMIGDTCYGVVQVADIAHTYRDPDARPFLTAVGALLGAIFERVERMQYQTDVETLLEDLGDATVRVDASGVTRGWNKRAEQLYGYTAAEAIGQRMVVIPPEEREASFAMVRRAMQGETVFNVETERVHKDGHRLNVLTTVSPWRVQGKIVGVIAVVKDISDRKALERELTEQVRAGRRRERDTAYVAAVGQACNSAADGSAILQALVDLTAEWTDDARVITVEGERIALAAYASRTPEEDAEIYTSLHYTYGAGSTTIGAVEMVRNIRAPIVEEMHHPTITLTPAPFLARGYHTKAYIPIRAAGNVVGILIAGARGETSPFDTHAVATLELVAEQAGLAITKDRLLRQVEAHVTQLEDANQHKDDFLASLSHELRTPLNAILGFGELIEDGAIEDPEELRDVAHDIVASGRLLLDQVNGLLDMARVSSGQMEMARELVNVPALVSKCERILAPLIATKQQHLRVSLMPDLPPVAADGARLQQVLINLLTNAYKFTPEGGTITVEGAAAERHVTIGVRDTGIGIAPEYTATIFEPFRRVETGYARSQSGTGLGLALSRRLIELMGGTLTLDSTPGSGSLFTVTLPQ